MQQGEWTLPAVLHNPPTSFVASLQAPQFPSAPSFWSRESTSIKQGIKTGPARTITYAIYARWNVPPVLVGVSAPVVAQTNL
jgi:hypothetical protein